MHTLQKIEILQALMAMFIPNVGVLLLIMQVNADQKNIFGKIEKPPWTMPVWAFTALWCVFYCVIGYASNLIFKHGKDEGKWTAAAKLTLTFYGAHLVLTWLWGTIFFIMEDTTMALIDMVLVDVTALHLIYLFHRVNSLAGYLMIPHCTWLLFVTIMNSYIVYLN